MYPIYCFFFTYSINDDVRDLLFETAYLMLTSTKNRMRVRSAVCEGEITTNFNQLFFHGIIGIQFDARLETEKGNLKVSYIVRPQDLAALEEEESGAWLTLEDIYDPSTDIKSRLRPNPIRRVAKKHHLN